MSEVPAASGHEKLVRRLAWVVALLPALAAVAWATLGARLPEPVVERQRLGEATMQWTFEDVVSVPAEPAHVVARAVFLGILQVPGADIRWTVAANALAAVLMVLCLAGVARRAFGYSGTARPFAVGVAGLLVCGPAFGADWLHGERIGLFLVPLAVVLALLLLQGERGFGLRAVLAIVLAASAPFCHTNGLVGFAAVVPALWAASRRAGSPGRGAWIVLCAGFGIGAAVASLWRAGNLGTGASGIVGQALTDPFAAALHLLRTTGSAWLDPLPVTAMDEVVLGAACWLAPLVLWRLGDRGDEGRRRAAPWWGCLWFGLLLSALQAERFGPEAAAVTVRELSLGSFLLPVGCIGLIAARLGFLALPVGAGMLIVLSLLDWYCGVDELRMARMRVESTEASLLIPAGAANPAPPTRDEAELQLLRDRCWIPPAGAAFEQALRTVDTAAPIEGIGACEGGDARTVRGVARSSLTSDSVQVVVVRVATGEGAAVTAGFAQPIHETHVRLAPWSLSLPEPLAEGSRLRAFGWLPRRSAFAALGPWFVLRDGMLAPQP